MSLFPAPRRLCAPSFVLLLVSVTLAAPSVLAGTYSAPVYTAAGNPPGQVTISNDSSSPYPYAFDNNTYGGDGSSGASLDNAGNPTILTVAATGMITATFTWQPAFAGEPAPNLVSVQQSCTARWFGSYSGTGTVSGDCDNGLMGTIVSYSEEGSCSGSTSAYQSPAADGSIAVTCSPSAHLFTNSGTSGSAGGNVSVGYTASVTTSPVTISLTGTTQDSSGNLNILVGQKCIAGINGIPTGTGWTTAYSWSISGTTFQSWTVSSNPTSTTEADGPGPTNVASPSWYWNDNLGSNGQKVEQVTCTATVTPPTGQGAAFSVTATQPVTVWVPFWTGTGTGGAVYVAPSGSSYLLEAADNSTSGKNGMTWLLTVASPNSSLFGDGTVSMVQLVIPGRSFQAEKANYHNSTNGEEGLDTRYPTYAATGIYWDHEDHPYFSLTNIAAANGADAYSATMHDGFHDYLCYTPPGSSQSVFLAELAWSTDATVNDPYLNGFYSWSYYGSGKAGTVNPSSQTNFFMSNAFPNWTQNSGNGAGYWNSNQ